MIKTRAYEIKFICYNEQKTTKTSQMKALVISSSPRKATAELERLIFEKQKFLVKIIAVRNLSVDIMLSAL